MLLNSLVKFGYFYFAKEGFTLKVKPSLLSTSNPMLCLRSTRQNVIVLEKDD